MLAMTGDIRESSLFQSSGGFTHHGRANTVQSHLLRTTWCAYRLCRLFRVCPAHTREAVRAAISHDLFGYDFDSMPEAHRNLFYGPRLRHAALHGYEAVMVAGIRFGLNKRELDAILKHMFPTYPVPPRYSCGWIVTLSDKIAAIDEYWLSALQRFGREPALPLLAAYGPRA